MIDDPERNRHTGRKTKPALRCAAGLYLLFAAAAPAATGTPKKQPDEIVVVANPRKCGYRMADRAVSDRDLDEHAKVWALGAPVRIVLPVGADRKCMIKVGMRLARQGVQFMEFVEPADVR